MDNLKNIEISAFPKFKIESSSFLNLANLTSIKFKKTSEYKHRVKFQETGSLPKISIVQTGAFDNLPKLGRLEFDFTVDEFEKEAFKEIIRVESFLAYNVKQTHLPRLFTNSPFLELFLFKNNLLSFDKNTFDGLTNLERLLLSENHGLAIVNEEKFKPVIEQIVRRLGRISMPTMDCGCDVKWLLSNPAWVDVFKTSTCLGRYALQTFNTIRKE